MNSQDVHELYPDLCAWLGGQEYSEQLYNSGEIFDCSKSLGSCSPTSTSAPLSPNSVTNLPANEESHDLSAMWSSTTDGTSEEGSSTVNVLSEEDLVDLLDYYVPATSTELSEKIRSDLTQDLLGNVEQDGAKPSEKFTGDARPLKKMTTRSATNSLPKSSTKSLQGVQNIVSTSERMVKHNPNSPPDSSAMPSTSAYALIQEDPLLDKNKKNAIQAKLNREKKKAYITELENEVKSLTETNKRLKNDAEVYKNQKEEAEKEVAYLKNVISNQSALSSILSKITDKRDIDVRLSTSFEASRKRSAAALDHDYEDASNAKKRKEESMSGGVCLHVAGDEVSLEFCPQCAIMSKGGSASHT